MVLSFCGTCICGAIGFTLIVGGGLFTTLGTRGVSPTPSELVGSIFPPSEIDYLGVAVEYTVVALHI